MIGSFALTGFFLLTLGNLQDPLVVQDAGRLTPYAQVQHEPIDEMSGIVKSRVYTNTYWVHNDSGDSSRIFAINKEGQVLYAGWENRKADALKSEKQPKLYEGIEIKAAANTDWEDISIDRDAIYVSDCGNNGNARRDLGVYKILEPNPLAVKESRALSFIPVAYPDQTAFPPEGAWQFDCEAIFHVNGKLHFLSKHRLNKSGLPDDSTKLYRLDRIKTDGTVNVLTKVDQKAQLGGWVTGADVSPDGKTLAVLCQAPRQSIWLFDLTKGAKYLSHPVKQIRFEGGQQAEAVTWDSNKQVIITNEQREMFLLNVK